MNWLANLASVNFRTVIGQIESVAFVAWLMVGIMLHRLTAVDVELIIILACFVGAQEGLNLTAFGIKRATFTPEAHEAPPREDVQPPKPPPPAAPVAPAAIPEAP